MTNSPEEHDLNAILAQIEYALEHSKQDFYYIVLWPVLGSLFCVLVIIPGLVYLTMTLFP